MDESNQASLGGSRSSPTAPYGAPAARSRAALAPITATRRQAARRGCRCVL